MPKVVTRELALKYALALSEPETLRFVKNGEKLGPDGKVERA